MRYKDAFIFFVLTIIMVESSFDGVNILTENLSFLLLGLLGCYSISVMLYERFKLKMSVKERPYLNYVNIVTGMIFTLSFAYNILFV